LFKPYIPACTVDKLVLNKSDINLVLVSSFKYSSVISFTSLPVIYAIISLKSSNWVYSSKV
jgi:hypothetical protein